MSAPYFQLEWKVENALRTLVLAANRDWVPVYLGSDNKSLMHDDEGQGQGIEIPCIICACDQLQQDMTGQNDGVFRGEARVEIYTGKHDEPGNAHAERVGWVRDVLLVDDIADQLSAAVDDFHCFALVSSDVSTDASGETYRSTITLGLVVGSFDA